MAPHRTAVKLISMGLVKKLLLAGTTVLLMATSASAGPEAEHRGHWVSPGQWQMSDIGRNHGVLGGPGIPRCNPLGITRVRSSAPLAVSESAEAKMKKLLLVGTAVLLMAS
jgi:hypothetical protein